MILKVAKKTNAGSLAAAIKAEMAKGEGVSVRLIGPHAAWQTIKALAISKAVSVAKFDEIEEDGKKITAITVDVKEIEEIPEPKE